MKAGRAELVQKSKDRVEYPDQDSTWPSLDDNPSGDADSLVMVMFPVMTWRAFSELAERLNLTTAETINEALRLLQERTEENDGA